MPVVPSGVKPSKFYDSQHGVVVDVQDHQGQDAGVIDQGDGGEFLGCSVLRQVTEEGS